MPKRSSTKKQPTDPNELAAFIVQKATSEETLTEEELSPEQAAARILGRRGGLRGGRARAAKLSAKRRKEIAIRAAKVRWGK